MNIQVNFETYLLHLLIKYFTETMKLNEILFKQLKNFELVECTTDYDINISCQI